MILTINGEPRDFPDGLTLAALIVELGMKSDRVAVELNLEIVPRPKWEATTLKDGDKLEIVHFVGGGSANSELTAEEAELDGAYWACPTCGTDSDKKFCPRCGEKRSGREDFSVRHLISHAAGEFFHYDSKMFGSFRLLFTRPGFLTSEYLRGCRKPHLHPFQLFFIANLIYFFLQPLSGWSGLKGWLEVQTHMMFYSPLATRLAAHHMAARGLTPAQLNHAFDQVVNLQARSLVVLIVPLFAVLLSLLEWRKRRYFGEHLIFSLHFTAFVLLAVYIGIFGGSSAIIRLFADFGVRFAISQKFVLVPLTYLVLAMYSFISLRRVYGDSTGSAIIKAVLIAGLFDYVADVYQFLLFLIALYSS